LERDRPNVVDLHGLGHSDDAAQLADLSHGLVEDGGNDASVSMRGRTFEAEWQFKFADEALVFFVQVKLKMEAAFIGGTATETVVAVDALLDFVSGDGFVARHETKMRHSAS
jgi:hypothetical protein